MLAVRATPARGGPSKMRQFPAACSVLMVQQTRPKCRRQPAGWGRGGLLQSRAQVRSTCESWNVPQFQAVCSLLRFAAPQKGRTGRGASKNRTALTRKVQFGNQLNTADTIGGSPKCNVSMIRWISTSQSTNQSINQSIKSLFVAVLVQQRQFRIGLSPLFTGVPP